MSGQLDITILEPHGLRLQEMRARGGANDAIRTLLELAPSQAVVIRDGQEVEIPTSEVVPGDLMLVRPGAKIPTDGVVESGESEVDESMVTGESKTVRRETGDQVVAGTVATDSGLRVKITATGDDTALAGIRRLVEQAQASTSKAQLLADRAAAWLFWFALGAAVITGAVWSWLGEPRLGRA